jgi:hypothetical protein
VGAAETVDGDITWSPEVIFNPATDLYVDCIANGKAIAVEFETQSSVPWVLEGYKIEFSVQGNF